MFKKLAKESIAYGSVKVLAPLFGFLTVPIFTRVFNQEQYGVLSLITTIVSILTIIFTLSLESAYTRYFSDKDYSSKKLFYVILKFQIVYGFSISIILIGVIILLIELFQLKLDIGTLISALYISLTAGIINLFIYRLRMNHLVKKFCIITLLNIVLNTFLALLLVYYTKSIHYYFISLCISNILTIILCLIVVKVDILGLINTPIKEITPLLKFSLPLLPASVAMFLNTAFDRWCIAYYLSINEVAIYSIGSKISSIATLGVTIIMFVFMPYSMKIIQLDREKSSLLLERSLRYCSFLFFTGLIILQTFSPVFISFVAPDSYSGANEVVGFLAVSSIFYGLTYFSTLGSLKKEQSKDYSLSITLGVILNCILNLILTPKFGIIGASISTMVGMFVTLIISFFLSHLRFPYSYSYLRLTILFALNLLWLFLYIQKDSYSSFSDFYLYIITIFLVFVNFIICFKIRDLKLLQETLNQRCLQDAF